MEDTRDTAVSDEETRSPADEDREDMRDTEPEEAGTEGEGAEATQDEEPEEQDPDEAFEEQQAAEAANQNAEGRVPEQRPIAPLQTDESFESETHRKVAESEEQERMDREAHERAASDEQKAEAAEQERLPNLNEGQRAVVDDTDSPHHGRSIYVERINYADDNARMIAQSGTAEAKAFAEVTSYVVKTRDGRVESLELTREQIKVVSDEQWGRGQF